MNKIRCEVCREELISESVHHFVECHCDNKAFTDGGDEYQRIGAMDLSKVTVWNEKDSKFEKLIM